MTETEKKYMAVKYFHILGTLLKMVDKYEIASPDHRLAYGKSALVFQNITQEEVVDEEHRKLRRVQVECSIDSMIEVLTTIEEGEMSDYDKQEFDEICSQVLEGEALKSSHIGKGKMVLCNGLVYQITDIDYDDFTIKLEDLDSGVKFWEKPRLCDKA